MVLYLPEVRPAPRGGLCWGVLRNPGQRQTFLAHLIRAFLF